MAKNKYIIVAILLSVLLNFYFLHKVVMLKKEQILNVKFDITNNKDLNDSLDVFNLLMIFFNSFNNGEYNNLETLWLIKDINNDNCPYPVSQKIFEVSRNKDNILIKYGYEDKYSTVLLNKDVFKGSYLYSFSKARSGNASVVLKTTNSIYVTLELMKNTEGKFCIENIRVNN